MAPYATFAFETAGGADGYDKGAYFELGVEPSAPLEDAPVSLSFPVTLGLSLNDYYQYMGLGEGHHEDDGHDHDHEGTSSSCPAGPSASSASAPRSAFP